MPTDCMRPTAARRHLRAAASALCDRTTVVVLAVLLVNDHVLKVMVPSWLTGKLSDFAGLYCLPFALLAATFVALVAGEGIACRLRGQLLVVPGRAVAAVALAVWAF